MPGRSPPRAAGHHADRSGHLHGLGVLAFGDSVNHGWILAAAELPLAVITASVLVLGRFAVLQPPGGQLAGPAGPQAVPAVVRTAAARPRSG
jgi:hypothetical protein